MEYKKRYFELTKKLALLNGRLTRDRCPVFKQCCAACNLIDELLKKEKKNGEDNS